MSKYIVIPNIKINNANAQPVHWIISAPAITAYVGFAHALALSTKAICHDGVAIIHHDIQFLGEEIAKNKFLPHQFRASGLIDKADYPSGSMSLSSQPTARCHLNISLVIKFDDSVKFNPALIEKFLRGARIAGGSLIQCDKIQYDIKSYDDALKNIGKNGWSILDRKDLMSLQQGDKDKLDTLLRNTRKYYQHPKTKQDTLASNAWIMPTCIGYAGISTIKNRDKAREGLPHVYVEPLVGLIQYVNTREAGLHFWKYTSPQPHLFITTTN